jgi:hypothetical protein
VQETFPGVGGIIILVVSEDAEKARRIIEESQRGDSGKATNEPSNPSTTSSPLN